MKKIQITTEGTTKEVLLNANETAEAIWEALPLNGTVNRWGDEIYFNIPVQIPLATDARAEIEIGEVAFWPPGQAFCIFWGPTPASSGSEPRAASPVNVFGKVEDQPGDFGRVQDGAAIQITRIEA